MGMNKSNAASICSSVIICCLVIMIISSSAAAQPFKCSSSGSTCNSIIDYVSPNRTSLSAIRNLFNVSNLRSLLGANNFPLNTSAKHFVNAKQTIKIPITCICNNGTGKSNNLPIYTVIPGDTLYHIAAEVFSGLVKFPDIQAANNISNADLIEVGQELRIPLPCSCDEVDGQRVVHYGHVVPTGSSIQGIAQQFSTSQDLLLRLNNLSSPNDLLSVLDVPLRACRSMVRNDAMDYPLLVPNGTYVFTATDCVMCKCDAANNWTLRCDPSQLGSTLWSSCPSMQCQGAENFYLGNSSSSICNRTTCSYAGYSNQTIFNSVLLESTCPDNNSSAVSLHGWRWNIIGIAFHLMLLCIHFR